MDGGMGGRCNEEMGDNEVLCTSEEGRDAETIGNRGVRRAFVKTWRPLKRVLPTPLD